MSFLSTNSSGNYSLPLNIKAGVYYCQQTLIPNSGYNLTTYYLNYYNNTNHNARINGRYNLEDNFECGYFNFDNYNNQYYISTDSLHSGKVNASYDYNFWGDRKNVVGEQALYLASKNICNGTVLSGDSTNNNAFVFFNTPSGITNDYGMAVYGRLRLGIFDGRTVTQNEPIFGMGEFQINPTGGNFPLKNNYLSMNTYSNNRFYWTIKYSSVTAPNVYMGQQWDEDNRFYNFLVTYDNNDGLIKFYESLDAAPLILRNITPLSSGSNFHQRMQCSYINDSSWANTVKAPKIWTDLGFSNRAWYSNDLHQFEQHRLNSAFTLTDSIIGNPPYPSGNDLSYLNFHFPIHSSGDRGSLNSGNPYECSYYVPLSSGISKQLYEFDKNEFNTTALVLDMWVENSGTNPSGYISAQVNFNNATTFFGYYIESRQYFWSGFPIKINNNDGPHLVRMSGLVYDTNDNLSDLINVTKSQAEHSNLFLTSYYKDIGQEYNGDIKLYSAKVSLDAWCTPLSTGNSINLYTSGQIKALSSLDLYLQQSTAYNNIDLFCQGHGSISSSCSLYIAGDFSFGTCPLYIGGISTVNSGCDLYIRGGQEYASMPLYIQAPTPGFKSGNIPLSMWATTNSGQFGTMSLFIGENAPSGVCGAGMNLYVSGPDSARVSSGMNLYIKSDTPNSNGQITLYCHNVYSASSGYLTLYMRGPVGTDGAVPISGYMNLFIGRDSESIAGGIPIYTSGPNSTNSNIPIYINGGTPYFSSIPLFTDGKGVSNSTTTLYSHGY